MTTKRIYRKAAIFLFSLIFIGMPMSAIPLSADEKDSDDIMAMLTQELKLSEDQAKQLGAEVDKFTKTLDALKAEQEKEGADPDALVKGAKQAQDEYRDAIKKILTPDQLKQYDAIKEKTLKGMFRDLAEIQLMDIQPKIGFSDDQLTKLVPIMGDSLYQVITIAWEHAGQRLRPGQKIKLAKELKRIQKEAHDATSKVLTPDQLQAWEQYKEQQRNKK